MFDELDLHGLRHHEVDRVVENFVLLNDLPVRIITGGSLTMRELVIEVLERHGLAWQYESFLNLGALIVNETEI